MADNLLRPASPPITSVAYTHFALRTPCHSAWCCRGTDEGQDTRPMTLE